MTITDLQRTLAAAGHNPGPIDGVMGPMTRRAVRAFQAANGLTVDGIVGPLTRAALWPEAARTDDRYVIPLDMGWLAEADRLRGLREGPGASDNPIIMDWARALEVDAVYTGDDIAWCGLFVAHCISAALPDEPRPGNILGARAWRVFGQPCLPQFGAVLVFWREDRNGWKGHVGFCWAWDQTHYHVLGGNQDNRVSVTRIAKSRLLEARWPNALPPKGIHRVASPAGVLISQGEA